MQIKSAAFRDGDHIPVEYTCNGDDISPPLIWHEIPRDTKSFAIICEDPDAESGVWSHWVLYNIPPSVSELEEDIPPVALLENGAKHGMNDFGNFAYGGPCPRSAEHRYYFRLYALDSMMNLDAGSSREDLLVMLQPHVLAESELMGLFSAS